ncbi:MULTISPECIES: YkvA family protein [Pelistega]|nr:MULTISPECIES: YkvA family protein [Pelistega]
MGQLSKLAKRLGEPLLEKALYLYYGLKNPSTPKWARKVIYGALAYLVLPVDAIPDLLPGVGFTDDLSVIAAALATVSYYITPEVKAQAKEKMAKWFSKKQPINDLNDNIIDIK